MHRVRYIFKRLPFLSNVVAYGTIYSMAEFSQQGVLMMCSPSKKETEWLKVRNHAIIGTVCMAPLLFCWYKALDFRIPSTSTGRIVLKCVLDQSIIAVSCIVIFYVGMSVLERRDDVFAELKAKFWSTYKLSCCFWLPAQAINFALLPPYTRVAFVGVASFIWVNVLCLVKRQEITEVADTLEDKK